MIFPIARFLTKSLSLYTNVFTFSRTYMYSAYSSSKSYTEMIQDENTHSRVYVALGSNVGDKASNLHAAIKQLRSISSSLVTSHLYQSPPMYYEDQPSFLNAVCEIETALAPQDLLDQLKIIEQQVGRISTFRNGPRVIDLDILLYNDHLSLTSERLVVPHPRLHERDFVLQPLHDLNPTLVHPTLNLTIAELWRALRREKRKKSQPSLQRVIPCYNTRSQQTRYLNLSSSRPIIMGIVNVTPDSFSDGGVYSHSFESCVEHALSLAAQGADILDLGGESTRPGARTLPAEEEIARVLPIITALREVKGYTGLLSIDTRKQAVARAAIEAGADLVNDVSAGRFDPEMIPYLGQLNLPYIAMHMRGTGPMDMMAEEHLVYGEKEREGEGEGPLEEGRRGPERMGREVGEELAAGLAQRGIDDHLPCWLQLVDPGIGFSKQGETNLQLLQPDSLRAFRRALTGRPVLVGLSRKRFLTSLLSDQQAAYEKEDILEQRDLATMALCCRALEGGADILRVHNVQLARRLCDVYKQAMLQEGEEGKEDGR